MSSFLSSFLPKQIDAHDPMDQKCHASLCVMADSYLGMLQNTAINPPQEQPKQEARVMMDSGASANPKVQGVENKLREASSDLAYISESEFEFEPVSIPLADISPHAQAGAFPTAAEFARYLKAGVQETGEAGSEDVHLTCEESTLEAFFEPLTGGSDPFNQSQQFLRLQDTFVETFGVNGIKVYTIGYTKMSIYIVGKVIVETDGKPEEVLVGLRTYKVET